MKLLTFAFVIQFIIACWPKIDIIINLCCGTFNPKVMTLTFTLTLISKLSLE